MQSENLQNGWNEGEKPMCKSDGKSRVEGRLSAEVSMSAEIFFWYRD